MLIETAMLVGMGFCAATLVALLLMPLVARRASRKAEDRLATTSPLDAREAAAERDGLRAVAAVEQRRAEQRIEQATRAQADTQAESGRRAARIVELEQAGEADRMRLGSELAQSREDLAVAQARAANSEQALADAQGRLRDLEEESRTAVAKRDEAAVLADERLLALTRTTTRITLLEAQLADRDGALDRERQDVGRVRSTLADITRDRDFARNELLLATTQRTMLESDSKDLTRRADESRDRLQARSTDLANVERRLVEERAEKNAAEAALAELRLRFQALEARLIESGRPHSAESADAELGTLRDQVDAVADQALTTLTPPATPKPKPRRPRKPVRPAQTP